MKKIITLFALLFFFYQTYTAQQTPENYALRLLADLASTEEPQPIQDLPNVTPGPESHTPHHIPPIENDIQIPELPIYSDLPELIFLPESALQEEEEETTATQHPNTQNLLPIKLTDQITGKTSYQCPLCNKGTSRKDNTARHIATHFKTKDFQCPLCTHATNRPSDLDTHIHSQHPNEKPYACILCGFTTAKFSELKEHNDTHNPRSAVRVINPQTGKKTYKCPFCNHTRLRIQSITTHMERHHPDGTTFTCTICNNYHTQARANLFIHMRNEHNDYKKPTKSTPEERPTYNQQTSPITPLELPEYLAQQNTSEFGPFEDRQLLPIDFDPRNYQDTEFDQVVVAEENTHHKIIPVKRKRHDSTSPDDHADNDQASDNSEDNSENYDGDES